MDKNYIYNKIVDSLENSPNDWEQTAENIFYLRNVKRNWLLYTPKLELIAPVNYKFGFFQRRNLSKIVREWKTNRFSLLIEMQDDAVEPMQKVQNTQATTKKKVVPNDVIKNL